MSGSPFFFDKHATPLHLAPACICSARRELRPEKYLQRLVHASPSLVSYRDFFPAARQIFSLGMRISISLLDGREIYISNLLVTDDGHLIIAAIGQIRNLDALHSVVRDVFDCGHALRKMSLTDIEMAIRNMGRSFQLATEMSSPIDTVVQQIGNELDKRAFSNAVQQCLLSGELLYLIAGDCIQVDVGVVATLIKNYGSHRFHFGLLELNIYETSDQSRFVVPRLLLKVTSSLKWQNIFSKASVMMQTLSKLMRKWGQG